MHSQLRSVLNTALGILAMFGALAAPSFANDDGSILKKLNNISTISSTVPSNGDVNPYGLVRVPKSVGLLREGHYLVSNFNANTTLQPNFQGTGTTIVRFLPMAPCRSSRKSIQQIFPDLAPGALVLPLRSPFFVRAG